MKLPSGEGCSDGAELDTVTVGIVNLLKGAPKLAPETTAPVLETTALIEEDVPPRVANRSAVEQIVEAWLVEEETTLFPTKGLAIGACAWGGNKSRV